MIGCQPASQRELGTAKKVAMEAKAEALKYKHELELAQLKLKQQQEKNEIDIEVTKNDGRLEAWDEREEENLSENELELASVKGYHGNQDIALTYIILCQMLLCGLSITSIVVRIKHC